MLFFMFMLFFSGFPHIQEYIFKLFNVLGKYSYEIYIVHYMFLVGVLSLKGILNNIIFESVLFVIATIISSYILKFLITQTYILIPS